MHRRSGVPACDPVAPPFAAAVEAIVDALALAVQPGVAAIATRVQSIVDAVALAVEALGAPLQAGRIGAVGASVETRVDAVAALIQAIVAPVAAGIEPVFDAIAPRIEATLDAIGAVGRCGGERCAGDGHQQQAHAGVKRAAFGFVHLALLAARTAGL
jgi:hypothetical protein